MIFADAATTTATAYNLLWILVGLLGVGGAGGAYGLYKWIKNTGVREDKIDKMLSFFEGDGTRDKPGLEIRMDNQDREIAKAVKATSSNGLNTNQVGDIAKRTENAVGTLTDTLNQHIGEEREARKTLWKEVAKKVDKP